ncbi:MAG: FG-GAP repeat protein [Deltaproteobacteria bacterium]|nr:FG-GAP repeat protein [Deltaproteobacteria bacterium]
MNSIPKKRVHPRLTASDTASGDACGWSVAVSCTVVMDGAPGHDMTGAAYIERIEGEGNSLNIP